MVNLEQGVACMRNVCVSGLCRVTLYVVRKRDSDCRGLSFYIYAVRDVLEQLTRKDSPAVCVLYMLKTPWYKLGDSSDAK